LLRTRRHYTTFASLRQDRWLISPSGSAEPVVSSIVRSVSSRRDARDGWHARAALEEARKVVRAHVHEGSGLGEPQVSVQVLLDVLNHPPDSARTGVWARLSASSSFPFPSLSRLAS